MTVMVVILSLAGCGQKSISVPQSEIGAGEVTGTFENKDTYILCAEEGNLALYVNPVTTWFYVENKEDGSKWYSAPANAENDAFADGTYRMEMLSNLIVSCENSKTQASSRFNSYIGSVLDGDFTISKLESGFRVDYHFKEAAAEIPLCVYLEDNSLVAEVPAGEITANDETIHMGDISVLPFFGAGSTEDEGYIFVADGTGGIIHFNNGKSTSPSYERPVYGSDPTKSYDRYDLNLEEQNIAMPVFGVVRNGSAFVSILEHAAANAYLCAYTNMQQTSYANVFPRFRLYESLDYEIGSIEAPVYESGTVLCPSFSTRYCFLSGDEADYNGMARQYRSYLIEKYNLAEADDIEPALYIELYGGVQKTVSNFGIQSQKTVPLTTTSQVENIAELLEEQGVTNLVIQYQNWDKDTMLGKRVKDAGVDGKIEKGDTKFSNLLDSEKFTFYPAVPDMLTFRKEGLFTKLFQTAADISGVSAKNHMYAPGIGTAQDESYYFLAANHIVDGFCKTGKALDAKQIKRLALNDAGNLLYNDYREGNLRRENLQFLLEEALGEYDETYQMMFTCPNVYAIPYATEIFRAPTVSSGQNLLDEDVPFYQMVVSGMLRYSAAPLNNGAVGEDSFLKALETGSMVAYTWVYEDASLVKNTDLSFLSSSNYKTYLERAAEQYKVTVEIAEKAGNGMIESHRKLTDGVYCLTYATGLQVYVNYNETEYQVKNVGTIAARSWLITERGE